MFWTVPGGEYKRGKGNCTTYIDTLLTDHAGEKISKKDHIVAVSNLTTAMEDRDTWKKSVKNISANDSVTLPKESTCLNTLMSSNTMAFYTTPLTRHIRLDSSVFLIFPVPFFFPVIVTVIFCHVFTV